MTDQIDKGQMTREPVTNARGQGPSKKPLHLLAVSDRAWTSDADLEAAAKDHSAQVRSSST